MIQKLKIRMKSRKKYCDLEKFAQFIFVNKLRLFYFLGFLTLEYWLYKLYVEQIEPTLKLYLITSFFNSSQLNDGSQVSSLANISGSSGIQSS